MRIALLNDHLPDSVGGAGTVIWALAQGLRQSGHEIHLITATSGQTREETHNDIAIYRLHSQHHPRLLSYWGLYNPQTVRPVHDLLQRIQPDVVSIHSVNTHLSFQSMVIANRLGFPVLFNPHGTMEIAFVPAALDHFVTHQKNGITSPQAYRLPFLHNFWRQRPGYHQLYNPFYTLRLRHIMRRHTHYRVSVSHAQRLAFEANGLPFQRTIHNGIDIQRLQVSSEKVEALRTRLGLQNRQVIYLGGRLSIKKGVIQMLQALNEVVLVVPQTTLILLSGKRLSDLNIKLADFPNLNAAHVRECGWLFGEELAAAYHLAEVVAVPSICLDAFPMTNLEAMAAGKPVIATCFGGSSEAIIEGETGYLVNPLNTEQFAARLQELLMNPALRESMGKTAKAHVAAYFTLPHMIDKFISAYAETIASHKRSL